MSELEEELMPANTGVRKLANRQETAVWFGVALTTVDGWVRAGAPVARRGSRGVPAVFHLRELAEWVFTAQNRRRSHGAGHER